MRAVVDTNVLIAGLLWCGPPHLLLSHLRSAGLRLVCSPALMAELSRVLARPKFDAALARAGCSRESLLTSLQELAEFHEPPALHQPVCRDPDDDAVLALAVAARVELIVSGDQDLLTLKQFEGIPIVDTAEALRRLGAPA